MIRNILWDVDGTLFDTYPAITYAYSRTLNEMGYSIPLNTIDGLVRTSFNDLIGMLHQRFKLDPVLVRAKFAESFRNISPANQPPFPFAREACKLVHQNNGLNIGFTTRSPESIRQLLDTHNFTNLMDDFFILPAGNAERVDPALLLTAIKKYTLNPAETLYIVDHERDIQAGKTAGVQKCLFGRSHSSTTADLQINDYRSLLNLLKVE